MRLGCLRGYQLQRLGRFGLDEHLSLGHWMGGMRIFEGIRTEELSRADAESMRDGC